MLKGLLVAVSLAFAGAALADAPAAAPAPAARVAVVDPAHSYQTLEGWGTSLCWWAHVVGQDYPAAVREDFLTRVFDPEKGLGLNVVRYNIGGGENPALPDSMQYRARIPGYLSPQGVWDWNADAGQRLILTEARKRGVNLCEAFSNSPPYWMTLSGSVTGAADGGSNLDPAYADRFADYLATVVKHFHDQWGVTFDSLEPVNESGDYWWKKGGRQEGCHFDAKNDKGNDQNGIIIKTAAALKRLHSPTPVSASDENSIDRMVASWTAYDAAARAAVARINTHSYGGSKREELRALAQGAGKHLWMSEYGDGDASGLTMSQRILSDMKQMRPTAWVYWQVSDGGGWGMIRHDENRRGPDAYAYTLNEKYWVMANYSRFLRPGCRLIDVGDDNSLAGYDAKTQTLVIVATNSGKADAPLTYDLSRFRRLPKAATAYRTSATESLAKLPLALLSGKRFATILPIGSVTTYVFPKVTL